MNFFAKRILQYPSISYLKHKVNPISSYSQKNEDLVVKVLLGKVKTFIDIGANDGISDSNSFLFALQGARGLCFEPVSNIFKRLSNLYFLNSRVICINEGISDEQKRYEIRVDGVISTIIETEDPVNAICLNEYIDKNARKELIEVKPLSYQIEKYPYFQNVDLVSIDVEGHELNVVKGIDFKKIKVKCIIIESLGGKTTNYEVIESLLRKNDFIPILTNELNTFFMHKSILDLKRIETVLTNFTEYRGLINN
jgi:FkbM family methyltransferase